MINVLNKINHASWTRFNHLNAAQTSDHFYLDSNG